MNTPQHITTLRQTHRAATSLLPMLTATLTVAGVVIAAMESRNTSASEEPRDETSGFPGAEQAQTATGATAARAQVSARTRANGRRVTLGRYIATLIGRILLVALGAVLVLGIVYLATTTGRVGQAITLTTLILVTLYLTEKAARR
ncbi:MAG TPA: hypothetical protein VFN78_10810 [Ktedonobacterales bacterium]|nr:hypothetical protein [Ktedonobacterales bacterium]